MLNACHSARRRISGRLSKFLTYTFYFSFLLDNRHLPALPCISQFMYEVIFSNLTFYELSFKTSSPLKLEERYQYAMFATPKPRAYRRRKVKALCARILVVRCRYVLSFRLRPFTLDSYWIGTKRSCTYHR
jgi:hypothetical protein